MPLVGARTRERLAESVGAVDVALSAEDLAAIEAAVPQEAVAGERYDTADGDPRQRALSARGMTEIHLTAERIIEAAEDVLRRYGPAKANVVDVARELGVSHGSVYRHFPSKAALRDAVAERWLAEILGAAGAGGRAQGPYRSDCAAGSTCSSPQSSAARRKTPSCSPPTRGLPRESRDVIEAHVRTLTSQLAQMISDGVASGDFGVPDSRAAAHAVFDATSRFHNPANAAAWSEPGIDRAYEAVRSLVLAGLAR